MEISEGVDYYKIIFEFVKFVDQLATLALEVEADNAIIEHAVCSFYEMVCCLNRKYQLPFVFPPSSGIVYRSLFSINAMAVSRMCGILSQFKPELDSLRQQKQLEGSTVIVSFSDGLEKIKLLNSYIWSYCCALWRNKVFHTLMPTDCLNLPPEIISRLKFPTISSCLSLSHSPAFSSLAWEYLKGIERVMESPETVILRPEMIKDDARIFYIEFLKGRGLEGIHIFLYTFLSTLAERKKTSREPFRI